MAIDRRNVLRRQQVIRKVVDHIVKSAEGSVTIESLRDFLEIPDAGARRIIASLVSAGILREISAGVWGRGAARHNRA
jgi:hypothetical protein